MNKDLKQLILKAVKSEKTILKGDELCRNIIAVQNIKKKQNLSFSKKLDLLEKYIKGIKDKSKNLTDMLEHSNSWEKESTTGCLKYLSSIGIDTPTDRKKYMDKLTGIEKKKKVKEVLEKTRKLSRVESVKSISKKESSVESVNSKKDSKSS